MTKKPKETMRLIPALYSKVSIFQISIQSGVVCGCVTSKSLFYLLINLYINMYALRSKMWVNTMLYMYYGDSTFTLTFTQGIKTSGSNAVVSHYLAEQNLLRCSYID